MAIELFTKLIMNSFELLAALKNAGYLGKTENSYWLENAGEFESLVSVILLQQTKMENVKKSLNALHEKSLVDLYKIANSDPKYIEILIQPSGFSNKKALRLVSFCKNIVDEFGDFESFKKSVSHEWLCEKKGFGLEIVDMILCYVCKRIAMVVDRDSVNLLNSFGYLFDEYIQIQEWFYDGMDFERAYMLFHEHMDEAKLWARYHGAISDFCKENYKNKKFTKKLFI